jgi:hypothetical protein
MLRRSLLEVEEGEGEEEGEGGEEGMDEEAVAAEERHAAGLWGWLWASVGALLRALA